MVSIKLKDVIKPLIFLCFMLFAVDFLGRGWYILAATFLLAVFYLILTRKTVTVSKLFLWVLLLACSNFLIMLLNSEAGMVTKAMKYLLSPLFGFFLGTILADDEKDSNGIFKLYMIAVVPYFIHGVLDLAIFRGFSGYERELADFWTGEMWKATLVCTYFAMTVPLAFLTFTSKGIFKRIAFFVMTAISVYASFITASRTVIFIGIIVILLEVLMYLLLNKHNASRSVIILIEIILAVAIFGVVLIDNMESIMSSDFFRRMFGSDITEEPRIKLFMNIIENTFQYPFGNMPFAYSHNTWLDFLRQSGWITFAFFLLITVAALKDLRSIYKCEKISVPYRVAVIAMMISLLLDMSVEPMMDGAAILFCLFFYFIGVNNQIIRNAVWSEKNVKIKK